MVAALTPGRRTLHVAVHDGSPSRWDVLREMDRVLREHGAFPYALLVIPAREGESLEAHPEFCVWLRGLSADGVGMILHGLTHAGGSECGRPCDRLRRVLFTRGEGEFLCLSEEESIRRIRTGRRILEEALGSHVEAFTAPAWLYSRGALRALSREGFRYAESRWREWDPASGRTMLRSPVLNFAGGGPLRRNAADLWVRAGSRLLAGAPAIRLALHPSDFEDPRRRADSIRLLDGLLKRASPVCPLLEAGGTGGSETTYNTENRRRPPTER